MLKIAYELVAMQMEHIAVQMVRDYFNQTLESRLDEELIEICGWTNQSFDEETLHRINRSGNYIINN